MQEKNDNPPINLPDRPQSLAQALFEPRPETIVAFVSGLLLFGLVTNLLSDFLKGNFLTPGILLSNAVAIAILFAIAFYSYRRLVTKLQSVAFYVEENTPAPPQRRGLVWILTPSGTRHTMVAIRHHYGNGGQINGLQHCWLIQQRGNDKVLNERHILEKELLNEGIEIKLHTVQVGELSVKAAYDSLVQLVENDLAAHKVTRNNVVVDITGGTKPMTAGLILGALSTDCLLEYVESDRDPEGKPIPDTARVVNVSRQAYLQAQK